MAKYDDAENDYTHWSPFFLRLSLEACCGNNQMILY